jgi:hypothetical protein
MGEVIPGSVQIAPPRRAPATTSELVDAPWTSDRHAEQGLVQAATIEQLQAELESAATEVISLKIAQHGLLTDAARHTQEIEALRAELQVTRTAPATFGVATENPDAGEPSVPTFDDAQAMPSRYWVWLMLAVLVVAGVPAWWISTGFRW